MISDVPPPSRPYHHGNLRPALVSSAVQEIEQSGPAAMSSRAGHSARCAAELGRARAAAATLLYGTGAVDPGGLAAGVAAWSIVHGLATLWLNGNLPAQLGDDPEQITRVVAVHLRPPRRDT